MNDENQMHLLTEVFPRFRGEYSQFPAEPSGEPADFYLDNPTFAGADPLALYCMVRHFRPQLILEVGGGYSTLVSTSALQENGNGELICVDPNPRPFLKQELAGLSSLLEKAVQDVGGDIFDRLGPGDILFIDSSHIVRYGSDVNYLYLEVLPRLKPGVLVHVHNIVFPADYPEHWITQHHLFHSKKYLLQAFLTFNSRYEVLLSNNYLAYNHIEELRATFPTATPFPGGGSLWMRRKG